MNFKSLPGLRHRFSPKLWVASGLAVVATWLFCGQAWGASLGVFSVFILVAVVSLQTMIGQSVSPFRKIAILLTGGLALALVNNPYWLPMILMVLGFATISTLTFQKSFRDATVWFKTNAGWLLIGWLKPWYSFLALKHLGENRRLTWMFKAAWLIPIILSIVFTALFAIANPIISEWFSRFNVRKVLDCFSLDKLVFFSATFWTIVALLKPFRFPNRKMSDSIEMEAPLAGFLSPVLVRNSLLLFNLLFLVQTGMDVAYLWGGLSLPDGMTYADYAHRGAYPLIVTALLAGGFVLFALRPGSVTERYPGMKWLVSVWILQNVFLTVSSIFRTELYVAAYSLTHLRVAALIWMGLVALGLLWMMMRIWRRASNRWLINANTLTLLVVLYTCSFVDFDDMVAWYNVAHNKAMSGQGQALDLIYFRGALGPAAIPALDSYERQANLSDAERRDVAAVKAELVAVLKTRMTDWHAWTWQGQRLLDNAAQLNLTQVSVMQSGSWVSETARYE